MIIVSIILYANLFNYVSLESISTIPTIVPEVIKELNCNCDENALLKNASRIIEESVQKLQNRLIEPLKNAISMVKREKTQLLHLARYTTLRDINRQYPSVLMYTDFISSLDTLFGSLESLMKSKDIISLAGIRYAFETYFHKFFSNILPSSFLCLSLGKCQTVSENYYNCMRNHSDNWQQFFGSSPGALSKLLSQKMYQYRKVEGLIFDLHDQLVNVAPTLNTIECAKKYSKFLRCNCPKNLPCRSTCYDSMNICFEQFTQEWAAKLHLMKNMTAGFPENGFKNSFLKMRKTMISVFRFLTERKSPMYATQIAKNCGALENNKSPALRSNITFTSSAHFGSYTEAAVNGLQSSSKMWEEANRLICNNSYPEIPAHKPSPPCSNGTEIVISDEILPPITKDVRPRPMKDWLEKKMIQREASGNVLWDDEDSENYDGSGSGLPPIIEVNQNQKTVSKNIDLSSTNTQREISVTVNEIGSRYSHASRVLFSFINLILIILFCF